MKRTNYIYCNWDAQNHVEYDGYKMKCNCVGDLCDKPCVLKSFVSDDTLNKIKTINELSEEVDNFINSRKEKSKPVIIEEIKPVVETTTISKMEIVEPEVITESANKDEQVTLRRGRKRRKN